MHVLFSFSYSVYVVFLDHELPPLAAASMWTRKDIKEFKESLRKDKDSVIKIGSGETVTVSIGFCNVSSTALIFVNLLKKKKLYSGF